jgi:multidrug efflux pump subunit AcrB
MNQEGIGISGRIARAFVDSEITPLLALAGILLGLFAILASPREEEPQINVTFSNVIIPFPGASAREVENLVSTPAEQVLSEISGIKHVYSTSSPGVSTITVQFKVGENRTDAILRLYDKVFSNQDWLPGNLGVGQPIVKPRSIDDVPIVTVTLWTADNSRGAHELLQVAHALEAEIKKVPGTRDVRTVGGAPQVARVQLDVQRLAGFNIALEDLRAALIGANWSVDAGTLVRDNQETLVEAGTFITTEEEIESLVVGLHLGKPVYLSDVAEIRIGAAEPESYVTFGFGPAASDSQESYRGRFPAVTMAVAKKPGTNAVKISRGVIQRLEYLRDVVIPQGIELTVTRDYGKTADAKAKKLIQKLIYATLSVVFLVLLTMGWREAIVVGVAVVITLSVTLFASWAYGFTLNRVSLFALIFSIGILVDDAIVIVENIHRHMQLGGKSLLEVIPVAVDEVGGPTILATLTVIAALLPMAFVTGLMGPYMSPIPINASMGMLISLAIAFVITPWLYLRLGNVLTDTPRLEKPDRLYRLFSALITPFISGQRAARNQVLLLLGILLLIVFSLGTVGYKAVVLKMLPFDNKSEFQIVVDMDEGVTLEETSRVLSDIADVLDKVPEVTTYQLYAGTASPIGFNGLVRQYYLRQQSFLGDIQVNLADQDQRDRSSHEIARAVRQLMLQEIDQPLANIKVVEVPPGPPVLSPLVAEIYGLDYQGQLRTGEMVREIFNATPDVVDVDDSIERASQRLIIAIDRERAGRLGVSQQAVTSAISVLIGGENVSYLHLEHAKFAVPIRLQLSIPERQDINAVLGVKIRSSFGSMISLSEVVNIEPGIRENAIHHKDLMPVVYVTGDMAGHLDSPLYAMFSIASALQLKNTEAGIPLTQHYISQPTIPLAYALKWDGEWQITYETFRDMGIAYGVGMILIYLLVVGQFRSYLVPLIIMAPIPLTVIGVMPGHALLDAKFTATSMIGMIALAGIIVRNSILLVEFINQQIQQGIAVLEAVIRSSAVRAKPIILTGLAAMMGAFFILDDPIFNGLAISLIFGILVSTLLTLVIIPVLYYALVLQR